MNCVQIYKTALNLIGEPKDCPSTDDYRSRTPALISLIMRKYKSLSEKITGTPVDEGKLDIAYVDAVFPLADELYPAVTFALASLLILDEIPQLSEILEKRSRDEIEKLQKALTTVGGIREAY